MRTIVGLLTSVVVATATFPASVSAQAVTPAGHWVGSMVRDGSALSVAFDFVQDGTAMSGTFSAGTQRALGIPLDHVELSDRVLTFSLGEAILLRGDVNGDRLAGSFTDHGATGTFALTRSEPIATPYRIEPVQFANGAVTLSGELLTPRTANPHAAVVFNHGSGAEGRFTNRFYADQLARNGIAALIYDKRGVGQSTGDWRHATYDDLADDAIAAIRFLKTKADIDPREIGIYGHSQGGTIAPLIATRSTDVAFIIAAAAVGMPVYQQDQFRTKNDLVNAGFTSNEIALAMEYFDLALTVARTGTRWPDFETATTAARQEKWYRLVAFPAKDNWIWDWYRAVGDYNGTVYWRQIHVPVLLVYGEKDQNTPVGSSIKNIEKALSEAHNQDLTTIILPGATHPLDVEPAPGEPFMWWHVANGYSDLLAAWIAKRAATHATLAIQ